MKSFRLFVLLLMLSTVAFAANVSERKYATDQKYTLLLGGEGEDFTEFASEDKAALRRAFQAQNSSLKNCFLDNSISDGNSTVYIKIEASGKVRDVSILSSSITNKMIKECLLSRIKNISFPQMTFDKMTKSFVYPLKFFKNVHKNKDI